MQLSEMYFNNFLRTVPTTTTHLHLTPSPKHTMWSHVFIVYITDWTAYAYSLNINNSNRYTYKDSMSSWLRFSFSIITNDI